MDPRLSLDPFNEARRQFVSRDELPQYAITSLIEGFQIIGHDWTYLYVNPAAAEHGRWRPDELCGRKMRGAYPGIEQTPLFALLTRCMSERTRE